MNPILQSFIGSLLRYGLMLLVPFLVKKGIFTQSAAEGYVEAAIAGIIALAWSWWKAHRERVKFITGLMPGPKTENEVIAHIKSGAPTPVVTTPPDTVPGVPK